MVIYLVCYNQPPSTVPISHLMSNPPSSLYRLSPSFVKSFRMNTCGVDRKRTVLSPFRMNTYKKPGVGAPQLRVSSARRLTVPSITGMVFLRQSVGQTFWNITPFDLGLTWRQL